MLLSISRVIKRDLPLAPKVRIQVAAWGNAPGFIQIENISAEGATHLCSAH
jgi:hypothetical protein